RKISLYRMRGNTDEKEKEKIPSVQEREEYGRKKGKKRIRPYSIRIISRKIRSVDELVQHMETHLQTFCLMIK
ncbi:MAG: hypothetical protein LUD14_09950, partial [Clostridiales bacterium]|nr:hypothetical protein [Clostridiales bacterium]